MNITSFTLLGGRPIKEDSYAHMQNGIIEALANMLKSTGTSRPEGVILWGCEITLTTTSVTNDTAAITAGAVYIDGEIYAVDAASGIQRGAGDAFVFNVVSSTASPSLTYFDASTQNPHLVRKAVLTFDSIAAAVNYMPYDADTWQQRLHGKLLSISSPTLTADGGGGVWTASVGSIQYQHNIANKLLHVWCSIETNLASAASAYLRIKLPVDQNGNQMSCNGLISGFGVHGTDLIEISADADSEYLRIEKNDGTSFSTGGLDLISFNVSFSASA